MSTVHGCNLLHCMGGEGVNRQSKFQVFVYVCTKWLIYIPFIDMHIMGWPFIWNSYGGSLETRLALFNRSHLSHITGPLTHARYTYYRLWQKSPLYSLPSLQGPGCSSHILNLNQDMPLLSMTNSSYPISKQTVIFALYSSWTNPPEGATVHCTFLTRHALTLGGSGILEHRGG